MKENSFKTIRNGAIASIIAGIVLLFIPSIRDFTGKIFAWFWSILVWCWKVLIASYALPGWAWIGIAIFTLIGIISTFIAIRGESSSPEIKYYTEDFIYNTIWRWRWSGRHISNLWCFCPTCDATLVYDDSSYYNRTASQTSFICENCSHRVITSINGGNKSYAIGAVEREIERRVRTGEYKKH